MAHIYGRYETEAQATAAAIRQGDEDTQALLRIGVTPELDDPYYAYYSESSQCWVVLARRIVAGTCT